MGSVLERARNDVKRIISNSDEFAVLMTFKTPSAGVFDYTFDYTFNSSQMFTLKGLHTKHHLAVNTETGERVNTKTASVTVSERFFVDIGYPIRNAQNEVDLQNHQVAVKDSTGKICTYIIHQWFPDETLDCIVCILHDIE